MKFFHTTVSWWSFAGVRVTVSLLMAPHVPGTLLAILANLNNSVFRMDSSFDFQPPGTVLSVPITIVLSVTFMFQSFFQFSGKVQVFVDLFTFFYFHSVVCLNGRID